MRPLPTLLLALSSFTTSLVAQDQFSSLREGRYAYAPFTALSSPVVLPMDGKIQEADWLTGLDVSLADMIFPHVHADTAYGTASIPQDELAVGHHDPIRRDKLTVQNLEFSLSGRLNQYNEFFVTYAGPFGEGDVYDGIFEEWFWKFKNLPGGFELRGGRVYNRFGIQNTYHVHGFDWVDQYLVNTRMFGDDSLTTIGAEITWLAPLPWTSQFDVALGVAPGHDDHAHGGHGHDEFEGRFNPEESHFAEDETVVVANWTNIWNLNDFHQFRGGFSGAWGQNHTGFDTSVYGAHFEYQWRQNGFDPGGRYFRVRSEAMVSDFRVEDEFGLTDHPASQRDFGAYLSLLYGFAEDFEIGLRGDFVSGNWETAQDTRVRVSPGITWYANAARTLRLRLQYNCDRSNQRGTDHSVWAQCSIAWGGPEVR
jgi:hypothetical protein